MKFTVIVAVFGLMCACEAGLVRDLFGRVEEGIVHTRDNLKETRNRITGFVLPTDKNSEEAIPAEKENDKPYKEATHIEHNDNIIFRDNIDNEDNKKEKEQKEPKKDQFVSRNDKDETKHSSEGPEKDTTMQAGKPESVSIKETEENKKTVSSTTEAADDRGREIFRGGCAAGFYKSQVGTCERAI